MDENDQLNKTIDQINDEDAKPKISESDLEWERKVQKGWEEILKYEESINPSQKNVANEQEWILQQIKIDSQYQIEWKTQWEKQYYESYTTHDAWEREWASALYTRHVYRKAKLIDREL